METLIDLLRKTCAAHRDKTALSLHSGLSDDAWSYGRLWNGAHAVARYLRRDLGLVVGDRVIVWGLNCPELVATYFGVMLARLIVVPIDPSARPEYTGRIAKRTRAAIVVSGFAAPDLPECKTIPLADLPFGAPGAPIEDYPAAHEIAEIVFTSGTTGEPKGVMLTHANIVADIRSARNLIPADSRYRLLSILPLSHMLEQTAGLYLPLSFGATIHYSQSRHPATILKILQQHHITMMAVVPQILRLLLDSIEREVSRQGKTSEWRRAHRLAERLPMAVRRQVFRDVHATLGGAFRFFVCGGAYLPPPLAIAWEHIGIKVAQGYGATECAPIISGNSLRKRVHGSVGKVVPGMDVRLSAEGEILVKGANVMQGYWQDEVATRNAFTDGGWYRTGDIGEIDRHGSIYLKGHLKDIVVLPNGLNVYPEDVERVLKTAEEVTDCIVLGLRDAAGNARVHAVVIPADSSGDAHGRVDQAVRRSNARLAPHQRIKSFSVWEGSDFPRTNTLKVKRHEVLATLSAPTHPHENVRPPETDTRLLRLKGMLAELGGVDSTAVTPNADLALDLHLDSLARVELAARLEADLGMPLEEESLTAVNTVAQLLELLSRAMVPSPAVPIATWPLSRQARIVRIALLRALVFPVHGMVCRPFTVEGREHLQDLTLPALFVANHGSHLDTPSILRALPARIRRRTAVAAAADYFYRSRPAGFALSLALNAFPFSREGTVRASLSHCGKLVEDGWSLLIYPEGTRSCTGEMLPFKSGIGLLATELQIPIVPIAVEGTCAILPKGSRWPRPGPVAVKIGTPIHFEQGTSRTGAAAQLQDAVTSLLQPGSTIVEAIADS